MINYQSKIYNGVNHAVKFFNSKNYAVNQKNQYVLTNPSAQPETIISQNNFLLARSTQLPVTKVDNIELFLPEALSINIDLLPNAYNYNIIIVSSVYAEYARQNQSNNLDYLDRLFTPIPLYSENGYGPKIGSIGLKKVSFCKTPQEYVLNLRAGYIPSVSAMQICIDMYKKYVPYRDQNTTLCLKELENYLSPLSIPTINKILLP